MKTKLACSFSAAFALVAMLLYIPTATATTPMSFTFDAVALSITAPTLNVSLGSEVSSTSASSISGQLGTVVVTDQRGGVTTRTASAIASAFTPRGGPADPASNISYAAGPISVSTTVVATAVNATDLTGTSTVVAS
jgi:hypothetical protein